MRTIAVIILTLLLLGSHVSSSAARGLPVAKYLDDPEHKNDIISFYLDAVFSGISIANAHANPPIFCMVQDNDASPFAIIDRHIARLQQEKRIDREATIDELIMNILISEYPCK